MSNARLTSLVTIGVYIALRVEHKKLLCGGFDKNIFTAFQRSFRIIIILKLDCFYNYLDLKRFAFPFYYLLSGNYVCLTFDSVL